MSDKAKFTYEVGKRYALYGSWSGYAGCKPENGEPLIGECISIVTSSGRAYIACVDEQGRVNNRVRWCFQPNGYAHITPSPDVPPLAVVLYELPLQQRTITIDGKTIKISEESFQNLKKELCT